jgi:hypothetical protein
VFNHNHTIFYPISTETVNKLLSGGEKNKMTEEKRYLVEKTIRVVKCNTSYAIGWGVQEDGTILVEIDKPSWERLEEKRVKKSDANPNMDYLLAETILQIFNEA